MASPPEPSPPPHVARRSRRLASALALIALAAATPLAAQDAVPALSLSPRVEVVRSHAPIPLEATIRWPSKRILRGRLKLEMFVNGELLHTSISREFALSENSVTIPMLGPAAMVFSIQDNLVVRATVESNEKRYQEEFLIPCPIDTQRLFVIGVVHPKLSSIPGGSSDGVLSDRFNWTRPFQLDRVIPEPELRTEFSSRTVPTDPADLPDQALQLLSYDLLLITNDGLAKLSDRQLDAIAQWVEGGGAVFANVREARSDKLQEFLLRLADVPADRATLLFDSDGVASLAGERGWLMSSPGVGKALIQLAEAEIDEAMRDRLGLKLWRVRAEQLPIIAAQGSWNSVARNSDPYMYPHGSPMRVRVTKEPELAPLLMPRRVKGVPFAIVAAVLGGCFLAVGPLEGFVLTKLRRRRWTWITFPALAIGFAGAMIYAAQRHLGTTDYVNTLTFIDLARDGRAVRTSRVELLFTAGYRKKSQELTSELLVALEPRGPDVEGSGGQTPSPYYVDSSAGTAGFAATWDGQAPATYTLRREVKQWQPQLSRSLRFGKGEPSPLTAEELALLTPALLASPDSRTDVVQKIAAGHPGAVVQIMHTGWVRQLMHHPAGAVPPSEPPSANGSSNREIQTESVWPAGRDPAFVIANLSQQISARPVNGPFEIFSQLSPNGAGNFEDLTLFNAHDSSQFLFEMIVPDGEQSFLIYRRLIVADAP